MSEITCPRCGYDLSGTVSTWETTCPLEGVCSECGLAIAWRDLLGERAAAPGWYVERTPGGFVRRWFATWVRQITPSRLWSDLDMRMRLRIGRLVMFVLMGVLCSHALLVTASIAVQLGRYRRFMDSWAASGAGPAPSVSRWIDWRIVGSPVEVLFPSVSVRSVLLISLAPVWIALVTPVLCVLFSSTLRLERVRRLHVVRISLLWLPTAICASAAIIAFSGLGEMSIFWVTTAQAVTLVSCVIWPLAFWHRALERYLRLRRPLLAAIVLQVASILLVVAFVFAADMLLDF